MGKRLWIISGAGLFHLLKTNRVLSLSEWSCGVFQDSSGTLLISTFFQIGLEKKIRNWKQSQVIDTLAKISQTLHEGLAMQKIQRHWWRLVSWAVNSRYHPANIFCITSVSAGSAILIDRSRWDVGRWSATLLPGLLWPQNSITGACRPESNDHPLVTQFWQLMTSSSDQWVSCSSLKYYPAKQILLPL
jgi:hypothetical protein